MHQLVADFLDLTSDLLARFHPQLDYLPDIFLEKAEDSVAGLEVDLALREKIRASKQANESGEKKDAFHISVLCPTLSRVASE